MSTEPTETSLPLAGGQLLSAISTTMVKFQSIMAKRYVATIEELTGRKVLAFLSQAHVDPDITMETFFVNAPLEGFGAVEIVAPH